MIRGLDLGRLQTLEFLRIEVDGRRFLTDSEAILTASYTSDGWELKPPQLYVYVG